MTVSSASLLSAAETAAKQANASSTSSSATSASASADAALSSLGQNYTEFLTLLTTQLQHQDPSDPMSTDSFTSELAQFAGVEQQVETNTNLASLITATQNSELEQSQSLVGNTATATSSKITLDDGSASLTFSAASTQNVAIAVSDSSGTIVKTDTLTPTSGTNTWTWDGLSDSGSTEPSGTYSVAVVQAASDGTTSTLSTQTTGTITGVTKGTNGVDVTIGGVSTSLDDVSAISQATTA